MEEAIYNACFGMAGFVDEANQTCKISNLKWPLITADNLQNLFPRASFTLINEVKAMGFGISQITEDEVIDINRNSSPKEGDRALIYAQGPGLGAASVGWVSLSRNEVTSQSDDQATTPTQPTSHVLSNANFVRILLITLCNTFERCGFGNPKPATSNRLRVHTLQSP